MTRNEEYDDKLIEEERALRGQMTINFTDAKRGNLTAEAGNEDYQQR